MLDTNRGRLTRGRSLAAIRWAARMQPEELLTTFAELGVAVAGFSGIVVVLGERGRRASPADRTLLGVLLWASAGVVLWALAPLLLSSAHVSERTTWVVSSAGWSIQQAIVLSLRAYQVRRFPEGMSQKVLM